jgi:hypothetical protein
MRVLLLSIILLLGSSAAFAGGQEGGLTLLEPAGARAAALGQAIGAVHDDITAFVYNPAALSSLSSGHSSFLFQQGLNDDSFGHLLAGLPLSNGNIGLSVAYYTSGSVDVFDGRNRRSVNGQRDLVFSLGTSRSVGIASIGVSGKFIRTELAETTQANAFAADLGIQAPLYPRLTVGAALQNIGSRLKYDSGSDELPRIARASAAFLLFSGSFKTSLLGDIPYHINSQEWAPAVGIETMFGLLALRAGYRQQSELNEFSLGTGLLVSGFTFDYSFGLLSGFDSTHRLSLSTRFGDKN